MNYNKQERKSEWISDRKMQCGVAFPSRMYYGPRFLIHCRVVRFDAEVESQQEVFEVEAKPDAV